MSSSTTGLPDMTGSVYNKTQVRKDSGGWVGQWEVLPTLAPYYGLFPLQTFDKQGFHAGTPPPFSLPSALGSTGPLAAGAAPGYAPPPFLHILPAHQQPHSQLLHHHLPQDAQVSPVVEAATLPWTGVLLQPLQPSFLLLLLRVARVSAASPAPCSPSRKPPSPPTATLPTGQTEPLKRGVGSGGAYPGQERTHGAHFWEPSALT